MNFISAIPKGIINHPDANLLHLIERTETIPRASEDIALYSRNIRIYPSTIHQLQDYLLTMPRDELEYKTEFLQVIPVVIVETEDDDILFYRRSGGETRLHNLFTCLVGGHMNSGETIYGCLFRELYEELGILGGHEIVSPKPVSSFHVISPSLVDLVHLGVLFTTKVRKKDLIKTDEITDFFFIPKKQIRDCLRTGFRRLLIHPGLAKELLQNKNFNNALTSDSKETFLSTEHLETWTAYALHGYIDYCGGWISPPRQCVNQFLDFVRKQNNV